ncbi:hypothetical protein MHYP_G00250280 [Metynnis hypsauchen]
MERSRAVLITLVCVLFSRISGAEVEMRVRPGDNVTLYCDCIWKSLWFRNCSHDHQPPLIMSSEAQRNHAVIYNDLTQNPLPRYFFVWNSSSQTHDLLVENVSESDLGLYYCAQQERKVTEDETGRGAQKDVYHYGNRTTRLSLLGQRKDSAEKGEKKLNKTSNKVLKPNLLHGNTSTDMLKH